MRQLRSGLLLPTALLFICLTVFAARGLTIKLGSLAPSGSPWDTGLKKIAAEWKKISNGKVTVKIYPGGIAGDESDMIRKMRIGQLDAAGLTGVGLCRIYPPILALQAPLTVRNDDELNHALDKMKPSFEKGLADKGFTIVAWNFVGWVHFFGKKPIAGPNDLRKQKLFIWSGDPDGVQRWKEMGFHPVPLASTDLMTSLQSGMVEAFSATPLSAASYQWFGLAPNMSDLKWAPLIGGIVISNKSMQRIPQSLRLPLLQAGSRISSGFQDDIVQADQKAIDIMKEHGLKIIHVSEEGVAKWREVVDKGIADSFDKSIDKDTYETIQRHLKAFRTE
ncbi:MAG: C4-dicarboxylate ABC transporter substrate-binding protein [Chitinivibrionales bacterium]|nr:C4-dicarboxylate ABC transporter substrate-binding protein [Chitinivibrionales bacterium]